MPACGKVVQNMDVLYSRASAYISGISDYVLSCFIYSFLIFFHFTSFSVCSWVKREVWSLEYFSHGPSYVLKFKQEIFSCAFFFWPNKLVNMLFMLCVTPVVSSQMQLCSPLAIQILFHKETKAGSSGGVV